MTSVSGSPYDPPDERVLSDVAAEMVDQLGETARLLEHWRSTIDPELGDTVPPHIDEYDVNYRTVDTWHGGNPRPALDILSRTLTDAGVLTRLRSSSIGALERRDARWARKHRTQQPPPRSTRRHWEVTDVDAFEATVAPFLRYPHPLPNDVRALVSEWAARPETNAGAPERGPLLDDYLTVLRPTFTGRGPNTVHRSTLEDWYRTTYHGMYDEFPKQLWRWLTAEGAIRKATLPERLRLGPLPAGTRVYNRERLTIALPELAGDD